MFYQTFDYRGNEVTVSWDKADAVVYVGNVAHTIELERSAAYELIRALKLALEDAELPNT